MVKIDKAVGRVKIYIIRCVIITLTFVAFVFLPFVFLPFVFSQDNKNLSELETLHKDIQIINLLNNLSLSKEQMAFIIEKAELAKEIRRELFDKIQDRSTELINAYMAIKKETEAGKVVLDKHLVKKFKEIKDQIKQIKKDEEQKIDSLALSIENKLEEFQIIALDNYKPCIIPIVNNGRIGQSEPSLGLSKLLERVKKMPETQYNQKKNQIAKDLLEKTRERYPAHIQFEESKITSIILETFEEARTIPEVEFMIEKDALTEKLKNNILSQKRKNSRKDKIKKFLLCDNVIPIIKKQLEKLAALPQEACLRRLTFRGT